MIAAPVQGDVDGIPKGSHYASVPPLNSAMISPMTISGKKLTWRLDTASAW